jgi:hypothetical protein
VQIVGDTIAEPTETLTVALSNPSAGFTIEDGTGTVTIVDNDGAMFAAAAAPAGTTVAAPLTGSALAPVLAQAEAAWLPAVPGASFAGVTVKVADLAGGPLGFTLDENITIDPTAAGWGWSVMDPGGTAPRMDLLAVLMHELGLALGFTEADPAQPEVMARTLAPAVGPQAPPRLRLPVTPFVGPPALSRHPAPARPVSGPSSQSWIRLAAPGWISSSAPLRWSCAWCSLRRIHAQVGPRRGRGFPCAARAATAARASSASSARRSSATALAGWTPAAAIRCSAAAAAPSAPAA